MKNLEKAMKESKLHKNNIQMADEFDDTIRGALDPQNTKIKRSLPMGPWYIKHGALIAVLLIVALLASFNFNTIVHYGRQLLDNIFNEETQEQSYNIMGNTSSNIANGSWVAADDEYIYYIDEVNKAIFKIDKDLNNRQKIIDGKYENIRIVGEWIYAIEDPELGFGLYRFKKDGSSKEKVAEHAYLFVNEENQWLYKSYLPVFDELFGTTGPKGIYRVNIDTKEEINIAPDHAYSSLSFDGQWLYYISAEDYGKIYRIKADGPARQEIINEKGIGTMVVEGEWIYYYRTDVSQNINGIFKMRKDGTKKTQVLSLEGPYDPDNNKGTYVDGAIVVSGHDIYAVYVDILNRTCILYKYDTIRGGKTLLYQDDYIGIGKNKGINMIDDYIYFNDGSNIYRIKTDGSGKEMVNFIDHSSMPIDYTVDGHLALPINHAEGDIESIAKDLFKMFVENHKDESISLDTRVKDYKIHGISKMVEELPFYYIEVVYSIQGFTEPDDPKGNGEKGEDNWVNNRSIVIHILKQKDNFYLFNVSQSYLF
jgi:hypothetical protein